MKTAKKIAVALAICAILVGLLLSFIAIFSMKVDLDDLNTVIYETNTYTVEDDFTEISIFGIEDDIIFLPSTDENCTIKCPESERISYGIKVENGELTVSLMDNRKWFEHLGFNWAEMSLTVYLPKEEYDSLYIKNISGDTTVPENFSFNEAEIISTSGDTSFFSDVRKNLNINSVSGDVLVSKISADSLKIQATSGDIELFEVKANENIELKTLSGDIEAQNIQSNSLKANSTSGDIEFEKLITEKDIHIETVSGNINLHGCDGDNLKLKSISGTIKGTLLSEKIFYAETTSGNVNVPRTKNGGACDIKTTSGDIHIKISE